MISDDRHRRLVQGPWGRCSWEVQLWPREENNMRKGRDQSPLRPWESRQEGGGVRRGTRTLRHAAGRHRSRDVNRGHSRLTGTTGHAFSSAFQNPESLNHTLPTTPNTQGWQLESKCHQPPAAQNLLSVSRKENLFLGFQSTSCPRNDLRSHKSKLCGGAHRRGRWAEGRAASEPSSRSLNPGQRLPGGHEEELPARGPRP